MKSLWIFLVVLYFFWPRDLVPDVLGVLGRIDDVLVAGYVYFWLRKRARERVEEKVEPRVEREEGVFDPFEVLEISRGASQEEIRAAYKRLAHQYHPDRVAHLGPELRELAHTKMLAIQRAYEQLARD